MRIAAAQTLVHIARERFGNDPDGRHRAFLEEAAGPDGVAYGITSSIR